MTDCSAGFYADQAKVKLDEALANSVTSESGLVVRNAAVRVEIPDQGFVYEAATGLGRVDTGKTIRLDQPVFIDSIGKTMTAVVILQLQEEGAFGQKGLDATLGELLSFPPEVLDALHQIDEVSYGRQITIRQLLNHTTGMKNVDNDDETGIGDDYADAGGYAPGSLNRLDIFDEQKGLAAALDCINNGVPAGCRREDYYLFQPMQPWDYAAWQANPKDKIAGQLNFYLGGMNKSALFVPGSAFYYSDTNYLILGLLIEKITGHSLEYEKQTRIFAPLGMEHTFMPDGTTPAALAEAGQVADYWGMHQPANSLGLVTSRTSFGDGGEFSTLQDLSKFLRALVKGKLFQNPATLDEMFSYPFDGELGYALGVVVHRSRDGISLWASGSSGCWMEYHSAGDISIVGTVNEIYPPRMFRLRADIYEALTSSKFQGADIPGIARSTRFISRVADASTEKVAWSLPVLLVGTFLTLIALIAWGIIAWRNSRQGIRQPVWPKWLAILAVLSNVTFLLLFVPTVASDLSNSLFGFPGSLGFAIRLPIIALIFSTGVLIAAIMAWIKSYWGMAERILFTFVSVILIMQLFSLADLGLLLR